MNCHKRMPLVVALLAVCSVTIAQPPSEAPPFPVRKSATAAIRLIEPFGVGGGPDLLARTLAPELEKIWGVPAVVENVSGAGATAGPERVARSPADGHTLLVNTSAQAYSVVRTDSLSYDPIKDFVPVASLTTQPYVLIASKVSGIRSIADLVAAARAKPGKLTFGSTGIGTATHIGVERLNAAAGIRTAHVPPRPGEGIAEMTARAAAGEFAFMMSPISIVLPRIRTGELVALGVTTTRRSVQLPGVPTIAESGIAGYDHPIWYGVWAPAGTPESVVARLESDFATVLATPSVAKWVREHDGQPMGMTRSAFAQFVNDESRMAVRLIGNSAKR
jgi:tripartite-type tricarboxylate transporter receptor subunit TctC